MTEPLRRWVFDIWADDDPAIARMRDALALEPVREPPQPSPDRTGAQPVESEATLVPALPPEESKRQGRITELVTRVRAGDLSAVDMLRNLLDR